VGDLVVAELERRHAAADTDLEPAVAEVIEDDDLLGEPQWRIERQQINQRPEPYALGRACDRAEIDARHWHQVERRCVMLGDMQAPDAGLVGGGGEAQPLIERGRHRPLGEFDVIENSNFHFLLDSYSFSSRFALPLAILALSSSLNGMLASQRVDGGCASNG
jgi:hypothetical protein